MLEGALLATMDPTTVADGVNIVWVLVACFLIFFMQPGFAMLEAGQVRAKNVANVLMKNLMDWGMGVIVFFLLGLGVYGVAGQVTTAGVALDVGAAFSFMDSPESWISSYLFSAVFAMTAATIVSGAVAERIKFKAYVFYSIGLTAIIYPVISGFAWGDAGLLTSAGYIGDAIGVGFQDFAGATVVHMLGGVAGLVGAYMVGPRKGRYDSEGNSQPIPGHSITLAVLGTFILAFGWYGFNVGTQATVLDFASETPLKTEALGRVALNTTLGMGGGAVAAALVTGWSDGKPDPLFTASGLLAGLVAVTGAVPHVTWYGGLILGLIGGAQTPIVYRWVTDTLKIDDVAAVFPVHGSAGAIGTLLIPVFAVDGFAADQLLMQAVSIGVIVVWTVVTTMLVFKIADAVVGLRPDEQDEEIGLDHSEHGYTAYPEFVDTASDGGVTVSSGDSGAMATDGSGVNDDD